MKELLFSSIEDIGALYRKKEISPVEITRATLERLHHLEPKLNAFITVLSEQALEQAAEAEALFLRGESAGKLTGIPVSVKDLILTKGIRTSIASRIMKDYIPDHDADVYTALRKSGAVVFGKNNMLEFAYGSVHPDYGQCNNPWDIHRTAGGSSTGSGASVAAGIGFASIGTDTGGSIRAPGSFCGIVGLKPTYEKVSRKGVFPLSHSLDHVGPLTRTVRDNAAVLEAISTTPVNFDSAFTNTVKGTKIGVIRSLMDQSVNPEVLSLVENAIEQLRSMGADVMDVELPGIESIDQTGITIVLAEASFYHKEWYPKREADYAPGTFANIKAGFHVSAVSYLEAMEKRREFTETVNEAFTNVDILVCPTFPFPATEKDPVFEEGDINVSLRTIPFNITGHPALTISAGNTASNNLPVGIQMIARHHDEAAIYRVADVYQRETGGYKRPPL